MSTIFEALREDHDKQRTLLGLVAKTHGDSEGRRELFAKLKEELEAHAAAEERSLYATLLADAKTTEKARHSVAEHKEIDDYIEELEGIEMSSPAWLAKFEKMRERVEHHLEEEEHEVFQMAGKVMEESEKTSAAGAFREDKAAELS